ILRRVDAALRRNAMCTSRRILKAERQYVVPELSETRRRPAARQSSPHHDNRVFPLISWIYKLQVELVLVPFLIDGAAWNFRVELHSRYPFANLHFVQFISELLALPPCLPAPPSASQSTTTTATTRTQSPESTPPPARS